MAPARRRGRPGALLLAPGAGADRDHRTLVAVAEALAPLPSERMDFPARKAGRRGPDRAPVAVAAVRAEAEALVEAAGIDPARLVLGGRSFGGRMCSMAVAEGLPAAGLVLLSYPLHPPGRSEQLRVDHFPALDVPCLFVSGERDPFGSPEELRAETKAIPGPVSLVFVPGGHDPKGQDDAVVGAVVDWLAALR
ncbi:MAG TPA: alpha/beta family hydrolase [Acidimicrobiales bacterium]|nr:alpha/beta family hydrolase [Acidimicrobiales bacterium]